MTAEEGSSPITARLHFKDGIAYSAEGLPFVSAWVAPLSIVSGSGFLYLVPPPTDHRFATALGKWDLFSVEFEEGTDPMRVLYDRLREEDVDVAFFKHLGKARNIGYYPERREYRDTRRVFYGTVVDETQEEALVGMGLVPVHVDTVFEANGDENLDFRRPVLGAAVVAHINFLRGMDLLPFNTTSIDVPPEHRRLAEIYFMHTQVPLAYDYI